MKEMLSLLVVDRPPIVGIDHREIVKLGALIEIGNAGNCGFQGQLGETVERAEKCCPSGDRPKRCQKLGGLATIENR